MVIFIKINEAESLNLHSIQSFTASEWPKPQEDTQPTGSAPALRHNHETERETVLTIVRRDGKQVRLCGAPADAALEILHGHGF